MTGAQVSQVLTPKPATRMMWVTSAQRAITYMRENLSEVQSVNCLAEVATTSPFHFIRLFRFVTGLPPAHYLSAIRLQAAKRLLLTTDGRVTDICFEVGYNSLGTFVRRFTEMTGVSPQDLRKLSCRIDPLALRSQASALLCNARRASFPNTMGGKIAGHLSLPDDSADMVFIGLFRDYVAHAQPLDCTLLAGPGNYTLKAPTPGVYFILAVTLPWYQDPVTQLLAAPVLRASTGPVTVSPDSDCTADLVLSFYDSFDPPVLAVLPALLERRLATAAIRIAE